MAEDQDNRPVGDPPSDEAMFAFSPGDPPTGGSGGGGIVPGSDSDAATEEIQPAPTETNLVGDPPTGGSGGGGGLVPPSDDSGDPPTGGSGGGGLTQ